MKQIIRIVHRSLLFTLLLGGAWLLVSRVEGQESYWREMIRSKQRERAFVENKIDLLSGIITCKGPRFQRQITDAELRFHTLVFLLDATPNDPQQYLAMRRELAQLRNRVGRGLSVFEGTEQDVNAALVLIDNVSRELAVIGTRAQSEAVRREVEHMRNTCAGYIAALVTQTNALAGIVVPARTLHTQMSDKLIALRSTAFSTITVMLMNRREHVLSWTFWRLFALEVREWLQLVPFTMAERVPNSWQLGRLALFVVACLVALFIGRRGLLRGSQVHGDELHVADSGFRSAVVAGVLGAAAFVSCFMVEFPASLFVEKIAGVSLLACAALCVGAIRRVRNVPDTSNVLWPLVWLFAFNELCELVALPMAVTVVALGAAVVWTSGACYMRTKNTTRPSALVVTYAYIVICAIMGVLALSGYPCMAQMAVRLVVPGVLCLHLAGALSALIHSQLTARISREHALLRTLATGIGMPLIWCGIIALYLTYAAHCMGGSGLVVTVLTTRIRVVGVRTSLLALCIIVVLFLLVDSCAHVLRFFFERLVAWRRIERNIVASLHSVSVYGLWAVYGIIILKLLGVELRNLALIASGVSVGIGFGLKDIVSNFVGGLIIILGHLLREGDVIEVDGKLANVLRVNVRSTVVQTRDNAIITLPNEMVLTSKLINWTRNDPYMRRDIQVGVVYGSDVKKVAALLKESVKDNRHVLQDPAPSVLFSDFGPNALQFALRVWIDDAADWQQIESSVRWEIHRLFAEHGINIAFPQLDVHVKGEGQLRQSASSRTPKRTGTASISG